MTDLARATSTFLKTGRAQSLWLFHGSMEVSLRVHSGSTISVLNVAMPARDRGKGVFTTWETALRAEYPNFTIRFEGVINDHLADYLVRRGYRASYKSGSRSFSLDKRIASKIGSPHVDSIHG